MLSLPKNGISIFLRKAFLIIQSLSFLLSTSSPSDQVEWSIYNNATI